MSGPPPTAVTSLNDARPLAGLSEAFLQTTAGKAYAAAKLKIAAQEAERAAQGESPKKQGPPVSITMLPGTWTDMLADRPGPPPRAEMPRPQLLRNLVPTSEVKARENEGRA